MSIPPLAPHAALRWAVVEPIVDRESPTSILEFGCGGGGFGARFAARADYVGVEPDATSRALAQSRIPDRVIASVDELDSNRRFAMVGAFEVLEHIEDDVGALSGWLDWAAPNALVVVSVPAWPDHFGAWDEYGGHLRRYTPEALDTLLKAAGCVDVRHQLYGWPLVYVTERVRNVVARRRGISGSAQERTYASARAVQPAGAAMGTAIALAVKPFQMLQRLRPEAGVALVGVGHRP
ncbi:MAG: methyltransferase domain-containing protein [Acidimicrobiaceae bacterium]|nr:methyltransferase domain-containing protein [Acidimicrobiaceae bacterium]